MTKTVITVGATYYIAGLGWVRFVKNEPQGRCRVIFQGAPIEVDRHELKVAA